jgi:large subunit ribosomal protein L31
MKEGIHPNYTETTITCVCGNVIETRSTKKDIKIEICSNCHPFMTGKQKIIDTAGRVEKFKKKYETTPETTSATKKKTVKK